MPNTPTSELEIKRSEDRTDIFFKAAECGDLETITSLLQQDTQDKACNTRSGPLLALILLAKFPA